MIALVVSVKLLIILIYYQVDWSSFILKATWEPEKEEGGGKEGKDKGGREVWGGGLGDFKMEGKEEAGKGVGELHNSSSLMLLDQT